MATKKKRRTAKNSVDKINQSKKHNASSKTAEIKTSGDQITSVMLFTLALFFLCVVLIKGENIWRLLHSFILGLFGDLAILLPVLLGYIAIASAIGKPSSNIKFKVLLSIFVIVLFCSAVYLFSSNNIASSDSYFSNLAKLYSLGSSSRGAGLFSGVLGIPFIYAFGITGAETLVLILLFVSIMLLTGTSLLQLFKLFKKPIDMVKENIKTNKENRINKECINRRSKNINYIDVPLGPDILPEHPVCSAVSQECPSERNEKLERLKLAFSVSGRRNDLSQRQNENHDAVPLEVPPFKKEEKENSELLLDKLNIETEARSANNGYHYPPLNLMERSVDLDESDVSSECMLSGQMLVETLKSFNVQTKIVNISRGPTVTRYELQPAAGVKISKITNLSDDIALNLAASGVRIEAPIPGKAAVGIEIPNKLVNIVRMRELLESKRFSIAKSNLTVILGKDIAGNVTLADLSKMPHLLIAGSTGSGKSVCINSFIISLLYKATPDEVRFLMVDPKVVELGIYNGIPHLLVPVVTDPRKAAGALNWAVHEMLDRYKTFAENNVRDLQSYNKMVKRRSENDSINDEPKLTPMPQIVIIIDELADLMMAAPNEVEDSICRLAQMARAAGMHLVIATQRPSVDVITGIIKANIPSRIALAVSSQIDSRTILDMGGAEKLLGRGDMLFSPIGASKPIRVQGCYVTDKEIESVIDFIKKAQESGYDQTIMDEIEKNSISEQNKDSRYDDEDDPMMPEAIKCIVESGQASTSMLQRRLRLGYARAGRIIDQMEQMGIVGPRDGSKPRQVLITYQQWCEMNMRKSIDN